MKIDAIINGDAIKEMKKMDDKSIDLVVTSPPYNIKNSSGDYQDNLPHDQYVQWQKDCLSEMLRLIKDNGAIFYNHKWRVQKGLLQDRNDIVNDFPVRQIIIWNRFGGINFNKGYFLPTYEVIYLIAKKDFRLAEGANSQGDVWRISQERKNAHPAPRS